MSSAAINKLVLWNACSIRDTVKREMLSDYLERTTPLAMVITETHIKNDDKIRLPTDRAMYHEFLLNHNSRSSGVALIIHKSMNARKLTKHSHLSKAGKSAIAILAIELTTTQLDSNQKPVTPPFVIAAVYIKPSADSAEQNTLISHVNNLINYCTANKQQLIVTGDFNVHDTELGATRESARTNAAANSKLAECLLTAGLHCANKTYDSGPTHTRGGTLDLVLTSHPDMITSLVVQHDELTNLSDHSVLCAETRFAPPPLPTPSAPKWKLKAADWALYRQYSDELGTLASRTSDWNLNALLDRWKSDRVDRRGAAQLTANRLASELTERINKTAHATIGKSSTSRPKRDSLPPEIRSLIAERRAAQKRHASVRSHPELLTPLIRKMKYLRTRIKEEILSSRRKRFAEKCDRIEEFDGIKMSRKVNYSAFDKTIAKPNVSPNQIKNSDGVYPNSVQQSVTNFARSQSKLVHATPDGDYQSKYDSVCDTNVREVMFKAVRMDHSPESDPTTLQRVNSNQNNSRKTAPKPIHRPLDLISNAETDAVLSAVSTNTAAGDDEVHNLMLKNAGTGLRANINTIINYCHRTGTVPILWKRVKTIALYKSGDVSDPNNYRTISLNSTLLKVMECAVLRRLQLDIPDSTFSDTQFGFRPKRSTADALHYVIDRIKKSFGNKLTTTGRDRFLPVVFLDISKAFDKVRPSHVLNALIRKGANPISTRWVKAYLENRSFYVASAGVASDPMPAENGTPQGAILSPFLFLTFIDEISKICSEFGVTAAMFADDVCLLPNANGPAAHTQLQNALTALTRWAKETHTTFNVKPSKSSAMLFTKQRGAPAPKPQKLFLCERELSYESTYKYLGLTLDCSLSMAAHRKVAIKNAQLTGHQITRIIHRSRTYTVHTVATIVRTVLIPRCMYASQFWEQTDDSLSKLRSAIVYPLKRALGLPRNSHTLSVLCECNVMTVDRYPKLFAINFIRRAIAHPHANPTTKSVAAAITRVILNERSGATKSRNSTALPSNVMTTLAPYTDLSADTASMLRMDQLAELNDAHWGSSLRLVLPSNQTLGRKEHPYSASTGDAQRRAAFRFDTVSPWRQYKMQKRPDARCDHCNFAPARAMHLLSCPGIARRVRLHGRWLKPMKRKIANTCVTRNRPSSASIAQAIANGRHPALSKPENAALRAASQRYLKAILAIVRPPKPDD